jgi:spermidine/putrescine transport system ATP-binding protein
MATETTSLQEDEARSKAGDGEDVFDVELRSITKRFGAVVAVDNITLGIRRGEFMSLLGPSGCGKTTTLRMIAGFEQPDQGELLIGGRDAVGVPPYRRDVNMVFQQYALFPHMSVIDNVAYGLKQRGLSKAERRRRAGEALELVRLTGRDDNRPSMLSGGQQQRVALARALVMNPRVLLLDEPLGALDLKLRKEMQLFIKALQHDLGITFIHVTHDQEEAMTMADSIAVMNSGHVEQLGSPDELYERPNTPFVARFLGVSNLLKGEAAGDGTVRLSDGTVVRAPASSGKQGKVAVGIRPEKIRLGAGEENSLAGDVRERAYIGVSTQYIVDTAHGPVTVYVQNTDPRASGVQPGDQVTLSWSPEATFVVDPEEDRKA